MAGTLGLYPITYDRQECSVRGEHQGRQGWLTDFDRRVGRLEILTAGREARGAELLGVELARAERCAGGGASYPSLATGMAPTARPTARKLRDYERVGPTSASRPGPDRAWRTGL